MNFSEEYMLFYYWVPNLQLPHLCTMVPFFFSTCFNHNSDPNRFDIRDLIVPFICIPLITGVYFHIHIGHLDICLREIPTQALCQF